MKIYALIHYLGWKAPENYYFSSLEELEKNKISTATQGMWEAKEIELNTQKSHIIWQTEWFPEPAGHWVDYDIWILDPPTSKPHYTIAINDKEAIEDYLQNNRSNIIM